MWNDNWNAFGRTSVCRVWRCPVEIWWHTVTHGKGKWRGNWRMEWVASTLHTTSEHGVSSITTADAHTSAASSLLNWRSRQFIWTRPFRRKTKSGFCACAITFQTHSTSQQAIVTYRVRTLKNMHTHITSLQTHNLACPSYCSYSLQEIKSMHWRRFQRHIIIPR